MSKKRRKTNKNRIVRSGGITATISMALVLFLIGLFTFVLFLARDMSKQLKESVNLSVVLSDDITAEQLSSLQRYILNSSFSKSESYISKEQALKEYVDDMGENPADFLGWNPLSASVEVSLNADYAHTDSLINVEKKLSQLEGVKQIVYQKDVISMLNDNVQNLSLVLLGLAVLMAIISFVLINNTIRLRIYSNRFLINTMKLVGATSWFIRRPYIRKGVFSGIWAALIAMALLSASFYYFKNQFGLDTNVVTIQTGLIVSAVVFGAGFIISALSTYLAVGKYLRMQTDDVYFA